MRHVVWTLFTLLFCTLFSVSCTHFPGQQVQQNSELQERRLNDNLVISDTERADLQNRGAKNEDSSGYESDACIERNTGNSEITKERDIDEQESIDDDNVAAVFTGTKERAQNSSESKNSEQEAVDDALALLSQSQRLWERGELDNALSLLDEAYSFVMNVNGDPDLSWQKDDLRLLIAKRIVEIYASRSNVAAGYQGEIPLTVNSQVEREIQRFQKEERNFFIHSYRRAAKYIPIITAQIKEAGLPEELKWLPLVESGFKIKALSQARALGLWQFIPSTGYKFGLKRDLWVDERMDVEKSTEAAIAYLKELHSIFGDWLTVLAAYNCGEGRVLRVISRQHMNYLDNFWDLYVQLPLETARYVPRFIATLNIIKEPEKYGFDLEREICEKPVPYETLIISKSMKLEDIASCIGESTELLAQLNSELRYKITPDREYTLKIPQGKSAALSSAIDALPTAKKPGGGEWVRHRIRKGESLSSIAAKYGSSVSVIVRANRLSNKHCIRAGKWLKIPVRGYVLRRAPSKSAGSSAQGATITYHVMKGDSLWGLAKRFGTTVSNIRSSNNLSSNSLSIGQRLKIVKLSDAAAHSQLGTKNTLKTYVVRKGDNPYIIARMNNMDLDRLLTINDLSKNDVIYPGQKLLVE